MQQLEWKAVLDGIRNCTRCQDLWTNKTDESHPLTEGEESARILVVSQDPSEKAWRNGVMFTKSSWDKSKNPTFEDFATTLLGERAHLFSPRHFCWTQAANCYTTLQGGKLNQHVKEMLRRCHAEWQKKIVYRHYSNSECHWQLIIVMGWAALGWVEANPGRWSSVANALRSSISNSRRYFRDCDSFVIYNPGRSNRELHKPEMRELQRQAIEKIRQRVEEIIQE